MSKTSALIPFYIYSKLLYKIDQEFFDILKSQKIGAINQKNIVYSSYLRNIERESIMIFFNIIICKTSFLSFGRVRVPVMRG